jgi:hypothetical protein
MSKSVGLATAAKIKYQVIENIEQLKNPHQIFKYIKILNKEDLEILPGQIPEGVEGIIFGSNTNSKLSSKNLPKTLRLLYLGFSFDQDFTDFPPNLQEVTFGSNFQGKIKNPPSSLKKLTIKSKYNHRLPYMPNTAVYLYEDAIGDNVFSGYSILMKKCKEKKPYVNSANLMVIKMEGYKSCVPCCSVAWLINLFNCF